MSKAGKLAMIRQRYCEALLAAPMLVAKFLRPVSCMSLPAESGVSRGLGQKASEENACLGVGQGNEGRHCSDLIKYR